MSGAAKGLRQELQTIASSTTDRVASLQRIAGLIRSHGNYRWVGLYDVDHSAGMVRNVAFTGQVAPEYPDFPITKGLTSAAVAERRVINVGNVSVDPRYLTAFGSTQSEIIVPIFDLGGKVVGTIDVESERLNAFDGDTEELLSACSRVIQPLWVG